METRFDCDCCLQPKITAERQFSALASRRKIVSRLAAAHPRHCTPMILYSADDVLFFTRMSIRAPNEIWRMDPTSEDELATYSLTAG